jgi:hypothetical protein
MTNKPPKTNIAQFQDLCMKTWGLDAEIVSNSRVVSNNETSLRQIAEGARSYTPIPNGTRKILKAIGILQPNHGLKPNAVNTALLEYYVNLPSVKGLYDPNQQPTLTTTHISTVNNKAKM